MIIRLFSIFILELLIFNLLSGNNLPDVSQVEENDSTQLRELRESVDAAQMNNLDSAISVCNIFLEKARSQNKKALEAYSLYYLGGVYDMKGLFEKAYKCYFESLPVFEKLNDKKGIGGCLNCIGVVLWEQSGQVSGYAKQKKLQKALEYLDKASTNYQDIDFMNGIGICYMNKGIVLNDSANFSADNHNKQQAYNKAIDFYQKAIGVFEKTGDKSRAADCNLNIALLHYDMFLSSKNDILDFQHFNQIETYLKKSLKVFEELNDFYGMSMVLKNMATIRIKYSLHAKDKGKYLTEAIEYADNSLKYADSVNALYLKYDAYYALFRAFKYSKDFEKALYFHQLYTEMRDSVHKKEQFKVMEEMETRYDTEKKEQLIEMQKKENQRQKAFLTGISFFLGLIIILVFILFRVNKQKKLANLTLNEKNEELNRLNNTQNKLISIISHDLKAPVSAFFSISNSLRSNIENLEKKDIKYYIGRMYNSSLGLKMQFENLLSWALSQSKGIKANKKNVNLQIVVERVVMILEEFAGEKNIKLVNNIDEYIELNTDPKLLSIVLNNLITNAIKFSPSDSEIEVKTFSENGKTVISVKDYGIGMNKEELDGLLSGGNITAVNENRGTGLGFTVSKEIVGKLGGKIYAESEIDKGTTFYIELYG
jgi:signal transduction histidine kinase